MLDEPGMRDTAGEVGARNIPQWTPSHGRAKAGRPVRTYIQLRCADTGCKTEHLPEAMDDGEGWRKRVRDTCYDDDDDDDDDLSIRILSSFSVNEMLLP